MKSYEVAHILVKAKYEADDIYKKIHEGISFESLATKYSTCSSAKAGGYLGKIKLGQADADFEEACLLLKPNQLSASAVRTKFGYHIIKRIS